MIRFVFQDGASPTVVSHEGETMGHNLQLRDLVFSWEAWRPPLASFDPVAGLDPQTYALTLRCFNGPVRCLSDAVLGRPWVCYTLDLPSLPDAADEVLYTCLLLGDALARQTYGAIIDKRISESSGAPDGYEEHDVELWERVRESLRRNAVPEFPIDEILDGKTSYHLLERSCITMALTSLDVAHVRIRRRHGLGDPERIRTVPGRTPQFVRHLAQGKRRNALLALPAAFHWIAHNQTVIPAKAHELLDAVGLLKRTNGKLVQAYYDNRNITPYGRIDEHLIY